MVASVNFVLNSPTIRAHHDNLDSIHLSPHPIQFSKFRLPVSLVSTLNKLNVYTIAGKLYKV